MKATDEDRWNDDGGPIPPYEERLRSKVAGSGQWLAPQSAIVSLPPFEHKEPADDDCGLPEHPIYADYSKYLWTSHRRSGGVQIVNAHGEPRFRSFRKAA